MNKVSINGFKFSSIKSVTIKKGKISVDGKEIDPGEIKNGTLEIKVTGTLENLETDGSVTCDDVAGDVQAGGSVTCDDVGGNVQCGGSVTCDSVAGSVMAGGMVHNG